MYEELHLYKDARDRMKEIRCKRLDGLDSVAPAFRRQVSASLREEKATVVDETCQR